MLWSWLLLSLELCLRTSKGLSVGDLVGGFLLTFLTTNYHIKTAEINTKLRHRVLELIISISFGVWPFAGGHSWNTWKIHSKCAKKQSMTWYCAKQKEPIRRRPTTKPNQGLAMWRKRAQTQIKWYLIGVKLHGHGLYTPRGLPCEGSGERAWPTPWGARAPTGASLPLLRMVVTWCHVKAVETRLCAKYRCTHRLTPPIKGCLPSLFHTPQDKV